MKRYILGIIITGAVIISGAFALPRTVDNPRIEKAVVQFTEPVKLQSVILKGDYLFVHDEEKMAKGEPCSYVYTYEAGKQGKLVASFHCIPTKREPVDHFTVIVSFTSAGSPLPELLEYRFAGSAEGHKVPAS